MLIWLVLGLDRDFAYALDTSATQCSLQNHNKLTSRMSLKMLLVSPGSHSRSPSQTSPSIANVSNPQAHQWPGGPPFSKRVSAESRLSQAHPTRQLALVSLFAALLFLSSHKCYIQTLS